jgi:hypothetical protein
MLIYGVEFIVIGWIFIKKKRTMKKRLKVTEAQMQLIFEHKMLQLLETNYLPKEPVAIKVTKEELINMMDNVNYAGHVQYSVPSTPTKRRKKTIIISDQQVRILVAKLMLIKNSLNNGEHVEGYEKDWVYYPNQYERMPDFGTIGMP